MNSRRLMGSQHQGSRAEVSGCTAAKAARSCPLRFLCHEHRRSKRRCATVREMKEGPFEVGDQFADFKPPQAAAVKSRGGERCGNVGTMNRQAWLREASATNRCRSVESGLGDVKTAPSTVNARTLGGQGCNDDDPH